MQFVNFIVADFAIGAQEGSIEIGPDPRHHYAVPPHSIGGNIGYEVILYFNRMVVILVIFFAIYVGFLDFILSLVMANLLR